MDTWSFSDNIHVGGCDRTFDIFGGGTKKKENFGKQRLDHMTVQIRGCFPNQRKLMETRIAVSKDDSGDGSEDNDDEWTILFMLL